VSKQFVTKLKDYFDKGGRKLSFPPDAG
jgi:hypothetical protein